MFLKFLAANQAWSFVMGDALIRLYPPGQTGDGLPMFFKMRQDAVSAAQVCGLVVAENGCVQTEEEANRP